MIRISSSDYSIADFIFRNHDKDSIEKMFSRNGISEMKPVTVDDNMFDFVGDW